MVSSGITPTPTYDANGNQTSATPATLTWNALNLPISVNSTTATYDARVHLERLRLALEIAFREAHLLIDPRDVLLSRETVMNEVGYRTKACFEWIRTDIRTRLSCGKTGCSVEK